MIKVGIVGMGMISRSHVEGYRAFPDRCRIVAACDIDSDNASRRCADQGLDIPIYTDIATMVERESPDLVSVCTPPFTHRDLTVEALSRGVHVLCEKPMASSLEECDAMVTAARDGGALLSIVAQNRFKTAIWNVKRLVDEGAIGKLLHTQVNSFWWRGRSYYDLWWRGTWEKEGGGCTLNHAVHHMDMLLWLTGVPSTVVAMMGNVAHSNSEVEDLSMALLEYVDRSFAQITSSVVHHGERQEIILQGSDARVSAPWIVDASLSADNGFPDRNPHLEETLEAAMLGYGALPHEGHTGQIDDVLAAIETDRSPLVTGEDGRNAIELITAVYKAATMEAAVQLPLDEADPFYRVETLLREVPRFHTKTTSRASLGDAAITLGSSYAREDSNGVSQ